MEQTNGELDPRIQVNAIYLSNCFRHTVEIMQRDIWFRASERANEAKHIVSYDSSVRLVFVWSTFLLFICVSYRELWQMYAN